MATDMGNGIRESTQLECIKMMLPVQDALEVLQGKWKLPIIISLSFGTKRFRQIAADIPGITDRMLSKELKELELNHMVQRTVLDAFPPAVEYTITEHGRSLEAVVVALCNWGKKHRLKVIGK